VEKGEGPERGGDGRTGFLRSMKCCKDAVLAGWPLRLHANRLAEVLGGNEVARRRAQIPGPGRLMSMAITPQRRLSPRLRCLIPRPRTIRCKKSSRHRTRELRNRLVEKYGNQTHEICG
jgi:hypothetical protein